MDGGQYFGSMSRININLEILDEIIAIYNQALVSLFKNQQFTSAPPGFIEENFTRDVETVEQFCNRVSTLPSRQAHEAFQEVLVANLSESRVGLYSMMHEKACIRYGYDSDDAIRLAYMCDFFLALTGNRLTVFVQICDLTRFK